MVGNSKGLEKSFQLSDQKQFADLSGDYNPMHLDALAARRTPAGFPVVHGMHVVLWALETTLAGQSSPASPATLTVNFSKFIYVGETARIIVAARDEKNLRLSVLVGDTRVMTVSLGFGETRAVPNLPAFDSAPEIRAATPSDLKLEELRDRKGSLALEKDANEFARLFPSAAGLLGPDRLAAMAAMSRLVGMVCPGLHSVFLGFKLNFAPRAGQPALRFSVSNIDERFGFARIDIAGSGIQGTIEALRRREPVEQPPLVTLKATVRPGEFSGQRALVIGGSRGLGALTAKLVAAGGGDVLLTYAVGRTDAETIADDINKSGGRCQIRRYDALSSPAGQLAEIGPVTHLYYFATGKIFLRKLALFEQEAFDNFCGFYVGGFYRLVQHLRSAGGAHLSVLYPSSVAVTDRPHDLIEYAMAKAAGELLCAEIERAMPPIKIVTARLPALLTDQMPSMATDRGPDAVDVLLPLIRQMQARSA